VEILPEKTKRKKKDDQEQNESSPAIKDPGKLSKKSKDKD
jgi:hypothetical protein